MRLSLAFVGLVECLTLLTTVAIPVNGGIRPSFDLDQCSWNATHIVLVKTTVKDGVFSVVESWKGDLKPGDSLEVAELMPDENAVAIASYSGSRGSELVDQSRIREQIPRQPAGSQMILFLKKQEASGAGASTKWGPASGWGGMKVSVLWIDAAKTFCFQQWMNPGPSVLSECQRWPLSSSDPDVFTARIRQVLQTKAGLAEALALKREDDRAERLGRIALGDVYPAQKEAMDALAKAGTVALPEILQVMDGAPGFYDGVALVRMFVKAAGKDSGRQLHGRLQQDVIYWETVGPTLTPDWLEQLVVVGSPLFVKFNETSLLVRELDREHYAPAAHTVAELRRFWTSQPQLYDPKWGERDVQSGETGLEMIRAESFGLAKECGLFLEHVGTKKQ